MVTTPTRWSGPTQVNTSDSLKFQGEAQVVGLRDGGYYVVWTDESGTYNPSGDAIVGQRFDVLGNKAGGEQFISGLTTGTQFSPALSAFDDDTVAVSFTHFFGGANTLLVQHFDPHAGMLEHHTISAAGFDSSVAALSGGSVVTSYTVDRGSHTDVVGRVVSAGGTVGPEFDIFNDTHNSSLAEVVRLANGNFVAVGAKAATTPDQLNTVFRVFTPAGVDLSGMQYAETSQYLVAGERPAVAALAGGGFAVAWAENFNLEINIRAAIYNDAGDLVTGDILANDVNRLQNEAAVTSLQDGGFLVSWDDDALNAVRGRRFDALGNRLGAEFTLSPGTAVGTAAGALLKDGRFVTVTGDAALYDDNDVLASIWDPRGILILGTAGADILTSRLDGATVHGLAGADKLHGFAGVDTLDGGLGADRMIGRGAGDTYVVDDKGDVVDETGGSGIDLVLSSISFNLANSEHAKGDVEDLTLTGAAAKAHGNGFANVLIGNPSKNKLLGAKGNDKLSGGEGADKIIGGKGADKLSGGPDDARDVFVFNGQYDSGHGKNSSWDKLLDFDTHEKHEKISDKIDLSPMDGDKHEKHDQKLRFVDHFAQASGKEPNGEVMVQEAGKNVKVLVDMDGDTDVDLIILVKHVHDLHRADFLL